MFPRCGIMTSLQALTNEVVKSLLTLHKALWT
jgi:hypothetical protein